MLADQMLQFLADNRPPRTAEYIANEEYVHVSSMVTKKIESLNYRSIESL